MTDETEIERLENLDESSTPTPKSEQPRYNKKSTRVQVAISRFYGMGGDDESWDVPRIAEHLRVSEGTVEDYVYETDMAREVEDQLAEAQARTRMDIAMDLKQRLRTLDALIDEAMEEKRPAVTSYEKRQVTGTIDIDYDELGIETGEESTLTVPVADKWKEVTKTDHLKDLWEEKRQVTEQLEALLGLEAPEQVESEHREIHQERKVWEFQSDTLPDQTVSEDGSQREDVIDVESSENKDIQSDSPIEGKD